ncbi:hypothetical protein [Methanothermococcus sp.]|uniref:hypothetical protein n=1 Tax=Methanothermococcus sp. TaxID=2614238 RepID=UPI0025DB86E9|nr:hypothetical protein [Methanothermococcus sp.]
MSILDYVSYYSFLDFWIYGTSTLLLPLYYPFVMLPIFEYLPLIIYITLLSNKIVATLYFLFLIVMPIVIFNILKKEKPTKNIKKYISIEYFAVLGLVFIYMLISLIPIYIYIHIGLIPFYLFDLKYLFFEYVKDFVIFYFLVVIGKVLGVYFNNTSISEVDTIA